MKELVSVIIVFISGFLMNAQELSFEGKRIGPNTRVDTTILIGDSVKAEIPITIINGKEKGPVLGIVAGIHGYEYPPIMAVQKLIQQIKPENIKGTLWIVNIANVPSFLGRRINVNPLDNKNLNRNFPGNEKGSITEKIAAFISKKIISRCDYLVDIHAGDAHEDLMPYAGYYNYYSDMPLSEKGKAMAQAMGFPYVVAFGNEKNFEGASLYTSREGISQHIPSVDIECGGLGQAGKKEIDLIDKALHNLMIYLQILKGTKSNTPSVIIEKRESVISNFDGIFYSDIKAGDYIKKGQKIGYITDFFGNKQEEIEAPVSGIVLYKTGTPPIKKGEQLFNIGVIYM